MRFSAIYDGFKSLQLFFDRKLLKTFLLPTMTFLFVGNLKPKNLTEFESLVWKKVTLLYKCSRHNFTFTAFYPLNA